MVAQIQKSLRDSKTARWIVLILISLTMFFAYFFVDVVAPLQELMLKDYGWSPEVFGGLGGSEFFLNVFVLFLIISGIILDKMGIRFTLITAGLTMVAGALIKYYALTPGFTETGLADFLNSFWAGTPATAKLAYIGFAIFGIGVEMAGITVSKTIVKWFKGKELALAMGLEMAVARLGVFAVFQLSPIFAKQGVHNAVLWGTVFLLIGFLTFLIYTFVDRKLDKQVGEMDDEPEEQFKLKDLKELVSNWGFISIVLLCVLFYSAIFPFQKFATDMLASKLDINLTSAARYVSLFPIGAMILTPFIGLFLDLRGKGATMMLYGAILLTISHAIFALVPNETFNAFIAIGTIVILGTAFSLVPASMWPSVPKIVKERYLGSAYAFTFWVQNIGLFAVPILIGWSLSTSNPEVAKKIEKIGTLSSEIDSIAKNIDLLAIDYNTKIEDFKIEFETNEFSEKHKNLGFFCFYLNDIYNKITFYNTNLREKYSIEANRKDATDGLISSIHQLQTLSKDSVIKQTINLSELNIELNNLQIKVNDMKQIEGNAKYNYMVPELIFSLFGLLAIIFAINLRRVDKRKGFGLDLPNKAKKTE